MTDDARYSELLKANVGNAELIITDRGDRPGTALRVIWPFTGGTLSGLVGVDGVLLELVYQPRRFPRPLGLPPEPDPDKITLYRRSPVA